VPAAAVIPAPVAYTNIAAVETFVVGLWALVCQAAGWHRRRLGSALADTCSAGTQPLAVWSSARTQMVLISSCVKSPSVGIETVGAPHTCLDIPGGVALCHTATPCPPPESTIAVTVENSVCPKQPELAECSSMECHSIDRMRQESCAGLGAHLGQHGAVPWRILGPSMLYPGRGCPSPPVVAASDAKKGTVQGARDCNARGEILRPLQDQQRRRRSARARSLIKSESLGIEDDQTPS